MKKFIVFLCLFFLVFVMAGVSKATLYDRGNGLIYCDTLDITFLQDANIVNTLWSNLFVHPEYGTDYDLYATWGYKIEWIFNKLNNNLHYKGFSDWRVPKAIVDVSEIKMGTNLTQNELSYLYYVELGNEAAVWNWTTGLIISGGLENTGPFYNIASEYWTSDIWQPCPSGGYFMHTFNFVDGRQEYQATYSLGFLWAVRDGDVAPVPEPTTMLLLSLGLVGLAGVRRKFQK